MTSKSIYPYVYKIVDKETGEFYIGSRHHNVSLGLIPEEDFLIHYFSSGQLESRLQDDPSNFECSIIFRSGEPEVAYWYEQLLIRENIKNPLCANKHFIDPDTGSRAFLWAGKPGPWKGLALPQYVKDKMSLAKKGRPGKIPSQTTRDKMSKTRKGKLQPDVVCPHCGKVGGSSTMKRWHFDKCKTII